MAHGQCISSPNSVPLASIYSFDIIAETRIIAVATTVFQTLNIILSDFTSVLIFNRYRPTGSSANVFKYTVGLLQLLLVFIKNSRHTAVKQ